MADRAPVLLKTLEAEPVALARLRKEYELFESLRLPAVLLPLAFLAEGPRCVIVLAGCEGSLLEAELGSRLPLARALRLGRQLVEAVGGLHAAGLIHGDLRPANVLVTQDDTGVRLVDLSRAASSGSDPWLPRDLAYISPEQAGWSHHAVDPRSDLYSLGVILYRCLTGALPFEASDPLEWVHAHRARPATPLGEIAPELPRPVSDIVMKLLAKPPETRYQSARGLSHDLTRCLVQWETTGHIEPFPLGERDLADRIDVARGLYGRDREIDALVRAHERVAATGITEVVLVAGYSGVGKSSLVQALRTRLGPGRGFFLSGKFDLAKRDLPYATFAQAFRALMQRLLSCSEEEIEDWRRRLREALGDQGHVIAEVIPEIELIIGEQPPVPELCPTEAQNRFHALFRRFLGAFTGPREASGDAAPLVLFLDDLQWLDPGSRTLMREIVTHAGIRNLLLIGAYRDNEVSPSHPLLQMLEEIRSAGVPIRTVLLEPLTRADLTAFVGAALHCGPAEAGPLAELIHDKTGGNPFYAIQFLLSLHDERLIELDPRSGRFRWTVEKIRGRSFTENVVALMVEKLRRLPASTRMSLARLACLGHSASAELLALALGCTVPETEAALQPAVLAGLVLRADGSFSSLHDRIQEAAYSLIPEGQRAEAHLVIGRRLLSGLSEKALADSIFDVVNQWNRGVALVTEPSERATLVRLDILAGRRARASTAYGSARSYLAQAAELEAPDAWSTRYEEMLELHLELAECESLVGGYERADALLDLTLSHARSSVDAAKVQRLRMRLYQLAGRPRDAVKVMLRALELLGVTFPESDEALHAATLEEIRRIRVHLDGRRIADLADAPLATDPRVQAAIGLLDEGAPPTYTAWPALWPVLSARATTLSLQHGNADGSPFGYIGGALVLGSIAGDWAAACELSAMSLRLNERFEGSRERLRGKLLFHHAAMVEIWCRPFSVALRHVEEAFVACLGVGDLVFCGYMTYNLVWLHFESGAPPEEVAAIARRHMAFASENHNDLVHEVVRFEAHFAATLSGVDPVEAGSDEVFDRAASIAKLTQVGFDVGVAFVHVMDQILAFLDGRNADALESGARAARFLPAVRALAPEATHHFFLALTVAALYTNSSPEEQRRFAGILDDALQKHERWARSCPENFGARRALLAAEIARIEGRESDAAHLYEESIRAAHDNGFVHVEAIAWEVAARFYRGRGFERIADTYLVEARDRYGLWGAGRKVRQLTLSKRPATPGGSGPGTSIDQLDLLAVIKASQAISREMVLDALLATLMRVVLQSAAAQRAALLLSRSPASLSLVAVASVDERGVTVCGRDGEAPSAAELPLSILHYVSRSRERVLLADAAQPGPFATDPYLASRAPPSICCVPILRRAELAGVLYLENELVADAFTPDRLAVLELLAAQAAISLENARLYTDLRREDRERRQAEAALRASKDLLQAIIDTSTAVVFVKDLEGRYLLANRRLVELMGRNRGGLLGLTDYDLVSRDQADAHRASDEQVLAVGRPVELEEVVGQGADLQTFLSIKAPLTDASGRIFALCGIATDITQRKQTEAVLRRTEEQLRQAQKMEAIGNLAGGVAHDFNNLLTVILSYGQMLAEDLAPTDPRRTDLEEIVAAGVRAEALTRQLLAFSRRQILQPRIVNLNEIVVGMDRMLRRLIGEDIELTVLVAPKLDSARVDPGQIEQVIMNLAVNSRDAMPSGGKLTLETANAWLDARYVAEHAGASPGPNVLLAVTDTGTGMDKHTQARMFEPFFTTKERGKGTGLGLATVLGIVQQSGGHIWVDSEPAKGTTFKIYFPRGTESGVESVDRGPLEGRVVGGTESVLLVEDDERVRTVAKTILERAGYHVLAAQSGGDALLICEQHPGAIHLLLTDVVMPLMSGPQLAERLCLVRPKMKVLYMSGYTDDAIVRHRILDAGIHFLQKPLTPESLNAKVRDVLGR